MGQMDRRTDGRTDGETDNAACQSGSTVTVIMTITEIWCEL